MGKLIEVIMKLDWGGNLYKNDFKRKSKKIRFRPRKKVRFKETERKHDLDQEKKKVTKISTKKKSKF